MYYNFNNNLAISPTFIAASDTDALITVEILLINQDKDGEQLHVANIQFNNLDIIGEFILHFII